MCIIESQVWQKIIDNRLYTGILFISIFIVGFATTYFGLPFFNKPKSNPFAKISNTIAETPEPSIEPVNTNGAYNVVLLGSGGAGHDGGGLTDSIIVISVNPKDKKAVLISIPRDLWTSGNYKINATVNNIGVENLKGTLQNITGLKIDKYASVDFLGIIKLVDVLGRVEVEIPKTFDDNFYPVKGLENETCGKSEAEILQLHAKYSGFELEKQFLCRYEQLHYEKGETLVDGITALKLARSRHGDSDFGRSARQFAIIKGVLTKLISMGSFDKLKETFEMFAKIVKTDLSLTQANELSKLFGSPNDYKITEIQLTESNVLNASKSSDGQYILIPKAGINDYTGIISFISGK